ncbi:MAG: formylglycine-generating enzyme family protein [Desulfobacteraceae bacterium]
MKKASVIISALICFAFTFLPSHAFTRQEVITNRLDMRFVLIRAGDFKMGSPKGETGRRWNEKLHKVTISKDFYIQETEVTQAQWKKLVGFNPSAFSEYGGRYPVDSVSWNQCREFIRVLNQVENTDKYRLPTEAEWEYACRAGSGTAFAEGPITRESCTRIDPVLDKLGWYCANSGLQNPPREFMPHPVKTRQPNAWGLYDMHGNVQEWVMDSCKSRSIWTGRTGPVTDTYKNGVVDPLSEKGDHRIIRGGGWHQTPVYCRSAHRSFYKPVAKRNSLGFRIVKEK